MKQVNYKINVDTKNAQKSVKNLNKEVDKTNKEVKETQGNLGGVSAAADRATGGMLSSFRAVTTSLSGVTKGFKTMRLAIISTGIGALVVLIGSLIAAFSSSEAGQNKFIRLAKQMGVVIDNLIDLLADLGEGLIEAFEEPLPAMKSFGDAIMENLTNRLEATIDTVKFLGDAFKKVFKGDFSGALDDAKKAGSAYIDTYTGVRNTIDKVTEAAKEYVEEQQREMKIAGEIADARAKADKIERQLVIDRAKANRDIAELRDIAAQKDKFSLEERKQALLDANEINERITNAEIQAARIRRDAIIKENKLSKSNKEALDKAAEARAKVIQLETAKLNLQKRLNTELATINTQAANEETAAAKKREEDLIKQQKLEEDALKKQIKREDEQYKLLQQIQGTAEEQEISKLVEQYDKKFELAQGNAELEKALTEQQNEDLAAINKKYREQELKRDKQNQDFKFKMISQSLGAIGSLADTFAKDTEEGQKRAFKINKAVGIAQALIQTFQAAQGAYLSQLSIPTPDAPIRAGIAAGVATAVGIANVASIAAQKFEGGGTSTGGTIPSPSISSNTGIGQQAPAFNVVGQSGFNQVAQALGQQNSTPIKAFVVSGDVTTAQALENNIIDTATF